MIEKLRPAITHQLKIFPQVEKVKETRKKKKTANSALLQTAKFALLQICLVYNLPWTKQFKQNTKFFDKIKTKAQDGLYSSCLGGCKIWYFRTVPQADSHFSPLCASTKDYHVWQCPCGLCIDEPQFKNTVDS